MSTTSTREPTRDHAQDHARERTPPGIAAGEVPRQRPQTKPEKLQPGERLMRMARWTGGADGWVWFGWAQIDGASVLTALHARHPTAWESDAHWDLAFHRLQTCEDDARALEIYVARRYPRAAWRWLFGADADELEAELARVNAE